MYNFLLMINQTTCCTLFIGSHLDLLVTIANHFGTCGRGQPVILSDHVTHIKMATESEHLALLEKRISTLERQLLGDEKVREGQPSLIRLVNTINGKLKALSDEKIVVEEVWKRTAELEKYLQKNHKYKLDERAKEELLLSYTEHLIKIQDQLEDINALKDSINSPSFRGLETHTRGISLLASQHIDQETDTELLANRVQLFVDTYTKLLIKLSQQCIEWDDSF